ncbi:hypothetical protein [Legionella quateirensis]|uniref:Reverse transcriptase (RNA-dependent DNA polymerase) n=1 Tax=Legionella quateirensis TaxID=45072 RepID=A0A378KTT9_9GAMM|nr:hypothetical protein [Legionella quateirensis]KTD42504.1 reverse transcriptase (RNA-dependent DNA polymerase) [Legionella quateirensis]STY17041.1 reverse transcriptase (RNA-dependent DNA polymerase) [Legionella quateirensis]
MLDIGRKLFAKIHKQKHQAHHNHDIHFLARELDDWLVEGVHALIDSRYTPRFLKRCYFPDEMIDQLHLSDRILQHVLLHQLKPTFHFDMNPNCYHLHRPSGVKYATEQVKWMVKDGVSPRRIISYLHRWCMWWVRTAAHWLYQDLFLWFLDSCRDEHVAAFAADLLYRHDVNSVKSETLGDDYLASFGLQVAI